MKLLARYHETARGGTEMRLHDIETQELIHYIPEHPDARRSLTWRAQKWAADNGHEIASHDYADLSTGEHQPTQEDLNLSLP